MTGDLNEITRHHEIEGGKRRYDTSFLLFNQMISDCGMIEFPYTRNQLSWAGKRTSGNVRCRLDYTLENEDWHEKFPHSTFQSTIPPYVGIRSSSGICNIISKLTRKRKAFKFDKHWLDSEEIKKIIVKG